MADKTEPPVPLYVPVALRQECLEHLMAAGTVVLQSALEAKRPKEEYTPLKEAIEVLGDALDKTLIRSAMAEQGPVSVGDIMLSRIQRQLDLDPGSLFPPKDVQ